MMTFYQTIIFQHLVIALFRLSVWLLWQKDIPQKWLLFDALSFFPLKSLGW